ncbi:hypothetical protein IFM89_006518, partial [Coptis chinensis]
AVAKAEEKYADGSLAIALIRQIGRANPKDYVKDTVGAENLGCFLVELADRLPKVMSTNVGVLIDHFGGESYKIRNALVGVLGKLVSKAFKDIEGDVVKIAAGRLEDKSAMVRKSALNLLIAMLQHNPFGPQLRISSFKATLDKYREKLSEQELAVCVELWMATLMQCSLALLRLKKTVKVIIEDLKVFSQDKSVSDAVEDALITKYIRKNANDTAKNLLDLAIDSNIGDLAALEVILSSLVSKGNISTSTDVIDIGFGHWAKEEPLLARTACIALQNLSKEEKDNLMVSCGNRVFGILQGLITGLWLPGNIWYAAAEKAITVVYAIHPTPESFAADVVKSEANLQLLFTIAKNATSETVRSNWSIALGDLAVQFPNLLEPWTENMYARLRDPSISVRRNAVLVLSHLILNDMMK